MWWIKAGPGQVLVDLNLLMPDANSGGWLHTLDTQPGYQLVPDTLTGARLWLFYEATRSPNCVQRSLTTFRSGAVIAVPRPGQAAL